MKVSRTLVLALVGVAATGAARAQTVIYEFKEGGTSGTAVDAGGDVNGDGFVDFIVGLPDADDNGTNSGTLRVFSGKDRSVLHLFMGQDPEDNLGLAVSFAGDVDHDGFDDFMYSEHTTSFGTNGTNDGLVTVVSGNGGATLFSFSSVGSRDGFGEALDGDFDVDADGTPDFLVGAPFLDGPGGNEGVAVVYSGLDGSTLHTFPGAAGDFQGWAVSFAGDVDADGFDDVLVGAFGAPPGQTGLARVHSGLTGATLYTLPGVAPGDRFGEAVGDVGDVNNDGFDDFGVASYISDHAGFFSGLARVFSGTDGSMLHEFTQPGDLLGQSIGRAGDIDGDGHDDILISMHYTSPPSGTPHVYSGRTGGFLLSIKPQVLNASNQSYARGDFDLNQDGSPDLMLGFGALFNGGARVYLLDCLPPTVYCNAKLSSAFCTPKVASSGTSNTLIGTDAFTISATEVLSNQFGILVWGKASATLPFGGGTLCVAPPITRTPGQFSAGTPTITDCTGSFAYHFSQAYMGAQNLGPGDSLFAQYWYRDPGFAPPNNIGLSDAVAFELCQ